MGASDVPLADARGRSDSLKEQGTEQAPRACRVRNQSRGSWPFTPPESLTAEGKVHPPGAGGATGKEDIARPPKPTGEAEARCRQHLAAHALGALGLAYLFKSRFREFGNLLKILNSLFLSLRWGL